MLEVPPAAASTGRVMIDLHTHSIASDGTLTPSELVHAAARAGVRTLALTDHDSVAGIGEALSAADALGVQLVAGIELSVTWSNRTLHLVGLNLAVDNPALIQALNEVVDFRIWRAQEIARKLEQEGVRDALAGARRHARTHLLSRTHFAHYLVEQGHARDIRQVFKRYLVRGKPGYVGGRWMSLEQGVELLHQAGGVAVLDELVLIADTNNDRILQYDLHTGALNEWTLTELRAPGL